MAESIFPFMSVVAATEDLPNLPVAREIKWDFDTDRPVYRGGEPVWVERAEAVAVWAWNALHTPRWQYPLYTPNYGNEIETLIGQTWTDDLKRAEVKRYIKECLLASPYVKEIRDLQIDFEGDALTVRFVLVSIYGTVSMEVYGIYV